MFRLRIGDHLKTPAGKRHYNERVFTEIAPHYDLITRALSFGRDRAWKRDLISRLPAAAAPRCLDLACGTGDIAFLLAEKYPEGEIIGLDLTTSMLERARAKNPFANVRFIQGDMSRLGLEGGSVDLVTGGYALRNAPDLDLALAEIARVLAPGGIAAFLDFSKPPHPWFARAEYWLLKGWTGLWGLGLHGNPEVYGYIAESLKGFPDRAQLRRYFERRGFSILFSRPYFLGIVELIVVQV